MLNQYSMEARENARNYFLSLVDYDYLTNDCGVTIPKNDFHWAAVVVLDIFKREKLNNNNLYKSGNGTRGEWFSSWLAGLPRCLDSFYLGDAVGDLCRVLAVGEDEPVNIDSTEAEKMLSRMIYNELRREVF